MEKNTCCVCQKPKATLECGVCKDHLCKYCAQILEEGHFSFLPVVPEVLSHTTYCGPCFDSKVATQFQSYAQDMEAAKNVLVFYKAHSKETRLIKRDEIPVQVVDCADEEEVLLRLAFLAHKVSCNCVVDIEIKAKKVRMGSYQTTSWSATGLPAVLVGNRMIKDKSTWHNPN